MRQTDSDKLCLAALKLAAQKPWDKLTLDAIAKQAKIARGKVTFKTTDDLLPALTAYFDTRMSENVGPRGKSDSIEDYLFEILMARIDVLQTHRAAVLSIADACRTDTKRGQILLSAQFRSIQKISEMIGEQKKPCALLYSVALFGLYHFTLAAWQRDETRDLAKTMAALDGTIKRISALERLAQRA